MAGDKQIVVFGAGGHTGRFVVAELERRGWRAVLAGRETERLREVAAAYPALEVRAARVEEAGELDGVLRGAAAVIHCAGPFLDTAAPVVEAALRARIHYLDVTAEQASALATFGYAEAAEAAGIAIVPAMAFYGGLADLLATAAVADWPDVDELRTAVALDRWWPTRGTRLTGARNTVPRVVIRDHQRAQLAPATPMFHTFPAPFGRQPVAVVPMSEIITISRHLRCAQVDTVINLAPLEDLRDPETPPPAATDATGRSAQRFVMEVTARRAGETRRLRARGQDIYATTATIIVEAAVRLLDGRARCTGARAAGELFDARDFLATLALD